MSGDVLQRAAELAAAWLETLPERPVRAAGEPDGLRGPLPEEGEDAVAVIEALAAAAEPGLVASAGPRYFGFVTGGALPVAVGADWLTSAWDQNACLQVMSPAAAAAEETVAAWAKQLLGLPAGRGRRARQRRADGQRHRAGRGAQRGARARRLGRRGARPRRRAARCA